MGILKISWDRLARLSGNPLLTFDWCYTCYSTIHSEDEPYVLVVSDGDEIVAIAPLVRIRYALRSRLEIVGTKALYEPSGLLASSSIALTYLLRTLLQLRLPLILLRLQDQDTIQDIIKNLNSRRSFIILRPAAPSVSLSLVCNWEDLEAQLSSTRKYDFKRKLRRAEKLGTVEFQEHVPCVNEMDAYFDIAMDVEHDSWKGRKGSSLRANQRLQCFFRAFLLLNCDARQVRFFFLKVGDCIAAMQITIEANESCWVLKQGFRQSQATISPGMLLSQMAIRSCLERGLSTYEFLGSEENWQNAWPIRHRRYLTIISIPYSISGAFEMIAAVASRIRNRLSSIGATI